MKKIALALVVLLVLLAGGFLGVRAWKARVAAVHETRAFARATSLCDEGRVTEAAAIVQAFGSKPGNRYPWADLDFRVLVAQANLPRLTSLFRVDPARVLADEAASLTVARAFLHLRQMPDFDRVRDAWTGREGEPRRWRLLDADRLLVEGRTGQAEEKLRAGLTGDSNDVPHLLRLALWVAGKNPSESVEFLNRAAALGSRQPDTRSLRAQVLEALGRTADARVEYVAAVVADPSNPIWRDQLAEFYRRCGSLDLALRTWSEAMEGPSFDAIWLKAAFWARMVDPAGLASTTRRPPSGPLSPLVRYLRELPEERFFDTNSFAELPGSASLEQERPEVFWLRLIDRLRVGDESEALRSLAARRPGSISLEPRLETALARILSWRTTPEHALTHEGIAPPPPVRADSKIHGFFVALEEMAHGGGRPETRAEVESLLAGKHAFAAAFLAAGWREAALRLGGDAVPETVPAWLVYAHAQALRYNRGHDEALAFLASRKPTAELELLGAEIRFADGRPDEARKTLASLARAESDVGMRAAWLLGIDAL
ncbi:MAG: hypothetical protein JNL97_06140, partial [Verrucomicrobiales bacterium]|nr:hypothetical protein [Verrucomicrobiales bacterium]